MPPKTILITQQAWQTFCENFPDAAQWLVFEHRLPNYYLPSLTPHAEPVTLTLLDGEPAYECPGAG